jgi:hypothetical protein
MLHRISCGRTTLLLAAAAVSSMVVLGQGGGRGGGGRGAGGGAPAAAQTAAPIDLTGYWVSLVTEDWRFRMVTPPAKDYSSVPINPAGRAIADQWNPDKDIAAGQACKAYGAAGLMRVPTRLHITWADPNTMKIETDAGTQTRLMHFGGGAAPSGDAGLQGYSAANWDGVGGGGRGGGGGFGGPPPAAPAAAGPNAAITGVPAGAAPPPPPPAPAAGRGGQRAGSMKVVTTHMSGGYLRKNGVPYSPNATLTEYYDRTTEPNGDSLLIITTIVEDPAYLTGQFVTSTHFKRLPDAGPGWNPTACEAK